MEEKIIAILENLGAQGIELVRLYLILDYSTGMVIFGLCAWGIRSFWKYAKVKESMNNE